MRFSLSTVITQSVLCSVLLLMSALILFSPSGLKKLGRFPLIPCVSLIALRFLLPFEFWFTKTIPVQGIYANIIAFLLEPIYESNGFSIPLYALPFVFAAAVSAGLMLRAGLAQRKYIKHISTLPAFEHIPYTNIFGRPGSVRCLVDPNATNALSIGLFRPTIVLPGLPLDDQTHALIVRHELCHIQNGDLFIKWAIELVCILNWWNPLAYLLRRQVTSALEIRADSDVVRALGESQIVDYMECLLSMAKADKCRNGAVALGFTNHTGCALKGRFELILKGDRRPVMSFFVVALFTVTALLSTAVVFEGSDIPPEIAASTFNMNEPNTYFVRGGEREYDLYVDGAFIGPLDEIPDPFRDMPIYNSLEEVEK